MDVTTLLPRDDASFGFDNVGVTELSPTLLERYLSAAQKISRLAVGSMAITPGSRVVTLRPDLTQEGHLDGLPFGISLIGERGSDEALLGFARAIADALPTA